MNYAKIAKETAAKGVPLDHVIAVLETVGGPLPGRAYVHLILGYLEGTPTPTPTPTPAER